MRLFALAPVALALASQLACAVKTPLRTSFHDGEDDRTLVLFLPGFAATDRTIAKKGVIDAMRDAGLKADVLCVDARFNTYITGQLVPRLAADVLPLARKYDHVWVMGISMGGLGTLMTAEAFRDDVEGIVLLSPFLGRRRVLDSLVEAGSVAAWTPPAERSWDDDLWVWMQQVDAGGYTAPYVYFARGTKEDGDYNRFFEGQLPEGRTDLAPGGHLWSVWRETAARFVAEELQGHEAFQAP